MQFHVAGFIAIDNNDKGEFYIGKIKQLSEIVRINRIDEIIFCTGSINSTDIIRSMLDLTNLDVDFKIAPPESISIIGSNSIHSAGDLYVVQLNAISKPANKRRKRIFDLIASTMFLCFSPAIMWTVKDKMNFFRNLFNVLAGNIS